MLVKLFILLFIIQITYSKKYKICIVDGKDNLRTSAIYCPQLDQQSEVECVIGIDQLDCLRRVSKKRADFTVLSSEHLIAAERSILKNILVTSELRYSFNETYNYELVAIVNTNKISSFDDIKGKRLCHPGYGYENQINPILANFLEAVTVPLRCNENLSLIENRKKSTSEFFKSACKAGPWVLDPDEDSKLKKKYANLCELCDMPAKCDTNDKYWGRSGAMLCLSDGAGDIGWVRLNDALNHFGITSKYRQADPDNFKFLCRDGTFLPLSTMYPCIWVVKPWTVIGVERTKANEIRNMFERIKYNFEDWVINLKYLMQPYQFEIVNLESMYTIDDYLSKAQGFLSANSFTNCRPSRNIRICTKSILEMAKCSWLQEASIIYGIEPQLDCIKKESDNDCFQELYKDFADITFVHPDWHLKINRDYNLSVLFYEETKPKNLYTTVAVVQNRQLNNFEDLKDKRSCFPTLDGVAWNTVLNLLNKQDLLEAVCPNNDRLKNYFSDIKYFNESGDQNAFRNLVEHNCDVAFIDLNVFKNYTDGNSGEMWSYALKSENFKFICPENQCALSVTYPLEGVVSDKLSVTRKQEILQVFLMINRFFGIDYHFTKPQFTLFGLFDSYSDVLFHDSAIGFVTKNFHNETLPSYDQIISNVTQCKSKANYLYLNFVCIIFLIFYLLIF